MNTLNPHKRGDTFSLACQWKSSGVAAPITGFVIKAQIRKRVGGDLIVDLNVINRNDSLGTFTLTPAVADTSNWPLGKIVCDLQITNGTAVRSSETMYIPVIEEVTQ